MNFVKELLVRFRGDTKGLEAAIAQTHKLLNSVGVQTQKYAAGINSSFNSASKAPSKLNNAFAGAAAAVKSAQIETISFNQEILKTAPAVERAKKATSDFKQNLIASAGAIKGLLSVYTALQAVNLSDQYTELNTRIKNVTDSADEQKSVMAQLFAVAQQNGADVTALADAYVKLNVSTTDAIKEQYNLVEVTDLISRGLAASGASAQTASGTILQLTQGLATNFQAAGQELNSLIEGAPALAKAIAEKLGGEAAVDLKRFAQEGKLTAETFIVALMAARESINAFELPQTVGRSWQNLQNDLLVVVGLVDETTGSSTALSKAIDGIRFVVKSVAAIFNLAFGAIKSAMIILAGGINTLIGGILTGINKVIQKINRISKVNIPTFDTSSWEEADRVLKESLKQNNLETWRRASEDLNFALGENASNTENSGNKAKDYAAILKKLLEDARNGTKAQGEAEKEAADIREKSFDEWKRGLDEIRRKQEETGNEIGDMLFEVGRGYTSLREVALKAVDDILRSMLRLSMGGTSTGGIFGGIGESIFGSIFGGGAQASYATAAARGASNPALYGPGFASGGSFVVRGNPGIDRNTLSLNGQPIANVAKGETVAVNRAGGQGVTINQTINVSTGVQQTVAAEITRYLPAIRKQTIDAVEDAQRRGRL